MTLRVLVGDTTGDPSNLRRAASRRSTLRWFVPKDAIAGDEAAIWVRGQGIIATATIGSRLKQAISDEMLVRTFPKWAWLRAYTRSYVTPGSDIAVPLARLLSDDGLRYWVVKARPAENDLRNWLEPGRSQIWRTKRPPRDWTIGDRVFIWEASPKLRVAGLAQIQRIARKPRRDGNTQFWLKYSTNYLDNGPTAAALRRIRTISKAAFLKSGPSGTLFRLRPDEASTLLDLVHAEVGPLADELPRMFTWNEGAALTVTVNRYERSADARAACVRHHGTSCQACGIDLEARYGRIARGFIHVHHVKPMSSIGKTYKVDPIKDLRPVCPNCHAMLHRRIEPYSINELKKMIRKETR